MAGHLGVNLTEWRWTRRVRRAWSMGAVEGMPVFGEGSLPWISHAFGVGTLKRGVENPCGEAGGGD